MTRESQKSSASDKNASHTESHRGAPDKIAFWPIFLISQSQISRAILSNACGFNQVLMLLLRHAAIQIIFLSLNN